VAGEGPVPRRRACANARPRGAADDVLFAMSPDLTSAIAGVTCPLLPPLSMEQRRHIQPARGEKRRFWHSASLEWPRFRSALPKRTRVPSSSAGGFRNVKDWYGGGFPKVVVPSVSGCCKGWRSLRRQPRQALVKPAFRAGSGDGPSPPRVAIVRSGTCGTQRTMIGI